MLACSRSMYTIAIRNEGPKPNVLKELSDSTNMPTNSGVIGLLLCGLWYFYFYSANLWSKQIFGIFSFDSSELPIVTIYGMYIPIFILFIKKEGKANIFKNVIMPILAVISSLFMIFAAIYAHGYIPFKNAQDMGEFSCPIIFYLIVYIIIMIIGFIVYKPKENN